MKRILVTGPESSGKTELVNYLSRRFDGVAVEEFARGFVERLGRPYRYADVEEIARYQAQQYDTGYGNVAWVFFDTWLIITRVWFEVVYKRVPGWIDDTIARSRFDLVLLCAPDIPWIADPVRENGGEMRDLLFEKYKQELTRFRLDWEIVSGQGEERFIRAERIIINKLGNGRE